MEYELYLAHHGVKGMKWGVRKARKNENKVERKYARAGKNSGYAEYYRNKADSIQKKHNRAADVLDKTAKKSEAKGEYFKAEASRRAAEAIRTRGTNQRAESDARAAYYERKASRITEKASTYATKKRVELGKAKIDSILNENKTKGYNTVKRNEEISKEFELAERLGDDGYAVYNRLRGRG